ncbi:hypothetical protein ACHAXS_009568, partial [Conticribra weissflogii]
MLGFELNRNRNLKIRKHNIFQPKRVLHLSCRVIDQGKYLPAMSDEDEAPFLINVAKDANVNSSGRSNNNHLARLNGLDIPGRSRRTQEPTRPGDDHYENGDAASNSPRGRHGTSPGTGGLRRRFRRRSTVKSSDGRDGDPIENTHEDGEPDGSDGRRESKWNLKPDCGPSVARQSGRREPHPP